MKTRQYNDWDAGVAMALVESIASSRAGPVLLCLQAVQEKFGFVHDSAVALIADACNVSRADVHGVLTFYADLRSTPPPAVPVRICASEACQAVGGRALKAAWVQLCADDPQLAELTGTDDPIFCLGNCALGPAVMIDGDLLGCVDVLRLREAVVSARIGGAAG